MSSLCCRHWLTPTLPARHPHTHTHTLHPIPSVNTFKRTLICMWGWGGDGGSSLLSLAFGYLSLHGAAGWLTIIPSASSSRTAPRPRQEAAAFQATHLGSTSTTRAPAASRGRMGRVAPRVGRPAARRAARHRMEGHLTACKNKNNKGS